MIAVHKLTPEDRVYLARAEALTIDISAFTDPLEARTRVYREAIDRALETLPDDAPERAVLEAADLDAEAAAVLAGGGR